MPYGTVQYLNIIIYYLKLFFTCCVMQAQVIPEPGSLIGDLLSMDIGGAGAPPPGPPAPLADLLGGGLDQLLGGPVPDTTQG